MELISNLELLYGDSLAPSAVDSDLDFRDFLVFFRTGVLEIEDDRDDSLPRPL